MQSRARQLCSSCWQSWRAAEASWASTNALSTSRNASWRSLTTTRSPKLRLATPEDWENMQAERIADKLFYDHYSQYGSAQTRDTLWQPHHSLHRAPSPGKLTLSALVAAGMHLGHAKGLTNPNFAPYAYGTRAGITIIDLDQTMPMLRRAANVTRSIAAAGGNIVFIGTRPDLRPVVKKAFERMGSQCYYVGERWLPGTLTNRLSIFGPSAAENVRIIPDLLIILNPLANMVAIREASIEHVPTISIIDSNVDPRIVMYAIPGNDESTRTAELVGGVLSIAGREGVELRKQKLREAGLEDDTDEVIVEMEEPVEDARLNRAQEEEEEDMEDGER